MNKVFEKIIEKLEIQKDYYKTIRKNTYCRRTEMDDCDSCRADHYLEARLSAIDDAIEIVKQEAEKYEECYKNCGDCEAYDKEKFHCPKFCEVIKETVKEIEENHNGWIPVEEELPETDKYILLSFSNFYIPCVGRYEDDENGGAFYVGDDDETCVSQDMFVNAWMNLPAPYQPKGE